LGDERHQCGNVGTVRRPLSVVFPGNRQFDRSRLSEALFAATDDNFNVTLWVTNGTGAGTSELSVANSEGFSQGIGGLTVLGSKVLFAGADQDFNANLWVTDGTAAGTSELSVPGAGANPDLAPDNFFDYGSEVLFTGTDAIGREGLWITNGTGAGTSELSVTGEYSGSFLPFGFRRVRQQGAVQRLRYETPQGAVDHERNGGGNLGAIRRRRILGRARSSQFRRVRQRGAVPRPRRRRRSESLGDQRHRCRQLRGFFRITQFDSGTVRIFYPYVGRRRSRRQRRSQSGRRRRLQGRRGRHHRPADERAGEGHRYAEAPAQ
jgi:ELWxxDGT repeat protein